MTTIKNRIISFQNSLPIRFKTKQTIIDEIIPTNDIFTLYSFKELYDDKDTIKIQELISKYIIPKNLKGGTINKLLLGFGNLLYGFDNIKMALSDLDILTFMDNLLKNNDKTVCILAQLFLNLIKGENYEDVLDLNKQISLNTNNFKLLLDLLCKSFLFNKTYTSLDEYNATVELIRKTYDLSYIRRTLYYSIGDLFGVNIRPIDIVSNIINNDHILDKKDYSGNGINEKLSRFSTSGFINILDVQNVNADEKLKNIVLTNKILEKSLGEGILKEFLVVLNILNINIQNNIPMSVYNVKTFSEFSGDVLNEYFKLRVLPIINKLAVPSQKLTNEEEDIFSVVVNDFKLPKINIFKYKIDLQSIGNTDDKYDINYYIDTNNLEKLKKLFLEEYFTLLLETEVKNIEISKYDIDAEFVILIDHMINDSSIDIDNIFDIFRISLYETSLVIIGITTIKDILFKLIEEKFIE